MRFVLIIAFCMYYAASRRLLPTKNIITLQLASSVCNFPKSNGYATAILFAQTILPKDSAFDRIVH
jgi:hypothetical protein